MPCFDCIWYQRPHPSETGPRRQSGICRNDNRIVHANYQCITWRQKVVEHDEVGLTKAEVVWARGNREDRHIKALNHLFRRIEFQPNDDALRREFAEALAKWRNHRANFGISLNHTK